MTWQDRPKRLTHVDGKIENKKEGKMAKGLNYEVEDMQAAVLHQAGSETINLSLDIMNIIVRERWEITYPFEYENIRSL
ncbi:hypothetical protein [Bacillus vallismortis]|uniref:hypothetical protein n=1 Tax=Bacillus vallismortis TaxID=72361 RepID=UPI002282C892|nr:hypothetical protein [Bacillus vallismortis]MCY7917284.1 hypothetical protein [Bacillus vallismortis]MCY8307807.1 hypothetical protein [Bacillus vallismortis]